MVSTGGGGGGSYIVLPTQNTTVLTGSTNPLTIVDQLTKAKYLYVSVTKTKVYTKNDVTSKVLVSLKKNARVNLLKEDGDWIQVKV